MAQINLKVVLDKASASKEIKDLKKDLSSLNKGMPNIDTLRKKYANLLNTIKGTEKNYAKGTFSKIAEDALANLEALKKLDPQSKAYAKTVKHLDSELERLSADFAETRQGATNFHGSLKEIIVGFGKFQLAAMLVMKPLQLLQDAWNSINETLEETEVRLISLRRVMSEEDLVSDDRITEDMFNLAQKYSKEVEDVYTVLQNFLRSGKSWEESILATESALKAMTVAELDAKDASEGLLAIMSQFKMDASETEKVVAILNKTADKYNVTTEALLEGLKKTGSYAKAVNLSFEETVGILTTLSENTNASGSQLGNAVKSLLAYTTKDTSLDTYAALSPDMASVVKKYRMGAMSILDVWRALGQEMNSLSADQASGLMQLSQDSGLETELEAELSEVFDKMTGVYDTAGTYRKNFFIALMSDIGKVENVVSDMTGSVEYSNKEVLEALESYNSKVTSLKSHWQEIANDPQGLLKFKKELVESAEKILTVIEALGELENFARKVSPMQNVSSAIERWYNDLPEDHWIRYVKPFVDGSGWGYAFANAYYLSKGDGDGLSEENETRPFVGPQLVDLVDIEKELYTTLDKVADKYEEIVNSLREAWELQKESYEFEEKKKAVLEAEKALEEAQKNRLVKTYNEALGDWEYVTNQKEIEKAKDRLEEARNAVEEAALKDIEKLLENDMVTNKDLDALLEKWATAYGEGDFSKFTDLVKEILKEFGIYLDAGKNTIGAPNDKVQAVTKDGDVAGNLLLSNAKKFSMSARNGLLFGVGADPFGVNQNQFTANRSTVDSHNVSYTVNGVPIPQSMAENRYLRDIFEAVALV